MRNMTSTHRNITVFYALTIAKHAIFVEGNWFFFWLRVMTHQQMGWVDATAFSFGLMMEIPTGAISDMVGKRKTLLPDDGTPWQCGPRPPADDIPRPDGDSWCAQCHERVRDGDSTAVRERDGFYHATCWLSRFTEHAAGSPQLARS